jgi:hypothetical protein
MSVEQTGRLADIIKGLRKMVMAITFAVLAVTLVDSVNERDALIAIAIAALGSNAAVHVGGSIGAAFSGKQRSETDE